MTVAVMLVAGEVMVRVSSPVRYMYPRYKYSPQYGFTLYENTRMVHGQPGVFQFHYTVNEYGYRGVAVPIADRYDLPNIVVLGDSFSFGQGVDDGDEYASRLREALAGRYQVINLATPGWGLTQEIRRYYEFGEQYRPEIVVLQYCWNDPEDNLNSMVTKLEDGEFVFADSDNPANRLKKYLSHSWIQRSQLYNFFRGRAYEFVQDRTVAKTAEAMASQRPKPPRPETTPREQFYIDLLNHFADRLAEDGVTLMFISLRWQLAQFPAIEQQVTKLDASGRLRFVPLDPMFAGRRGEDFRSPEGHWGPGAHRLIAEGLADIITNGYDERWH